jgi:hypothetical protein
MTFNKKLFIVAPMVLLLSLGSKAQSITQLIEQLTLDVQKLSELKIILSDMYKDYEVIDKGYTNIKNIAEGNFNLHKAFLDGLMVISPTVRNYPRIVDIINAEYSIVSEYKAAYKRFSSDGHFTLQELNYLNNTYSTLFQRSLQCIDELALVMTDNELRMSDDQRLQAIDRVYSDITGQLSFLRQFNNRTSIQAIQRLKEANDIETLKTIYGITN